MDPKVLENGVVLTYLIREHHHKRSEESFMSLLTCLGDDPPVWVPMNMTVSQEDIENILNMSAGGEVTTKQPIRMKPDILVNPAGQKFFPVFSRKEETPEEYQNGFSWLQIPFSQCVPMVLHREELEGIVLNGFTESVVLVRGMVEILRGIYENETGEG